MSNHISFSEARRNILAGIAKANNIPQNELKPFEHYDPLDVDEKPTRPLSSNQVLFGQEINMKKYKVIMSADIHTDLNDMMSNDDCFWNRFGNQFSDDFYELLKRYTGNTYLFRNHTVEFRIEEEEK